MKSLSLALSLAFVCSLSPAETQTVRCLVRTPVGVDRAKLAATVFKGSPAECETDWNPLATFPVDATGEFRATFDADENTQLEVAGPGIRRARFPWPMQVAGDDTSRATFDLDGGWTIDGVVLDQATGSPLADVLVGPVAPGSDAEPTTMERTFPFFTRTDAEGRFVLDGLAGSTSWEVPFFAAGHQRQRLLTVPGTPMRVELAPGGRSIGGALVGSRSAEPIPGRTLLLQGGPRSFYIIRRSDDAGAFRFDGLPAGEYDLSSFSQAAGIGPMQTLTVTNEGDTEGVVVFWPEGIRISGTARDIETDDPVPGATLTIRETVVHTDANGVYEFPLVEAPWPVTIGLEHPEFRLAPEDQATERWPVDGSDAVDVAHLELMARRKRVLEVTLVDPALADLPPEMQQGGGVLELHGPVAVDSIPVARERAALGMTVVPLQAGGTRAALIRSTDGKASDIALVETDVRQTTSTLALSLEPGGTIEGSLRYEAEDPPKLPAAPMFTVKLEHAFPGATDRWFEVAAANPTPEGMFTLSALPPGEFRLSLLRPEGDPWFQETVTVERGATLAFDRTIPRGVAVAGTVSDEAGLPLREVSISAYGDDPMGTPLHLKAVSDAEGRFRFEGFAGPTVREISASHAIHGEGKTSDIPVPDEAIALVLKRPSGIVVSLAPGVEANEALLLAGSMRSAADGGMQWFYEIESRASFTDEPTVTLRPRTNNRLRVAVRSGSLWDVSSPIDWNRDMDQVEVTMQPAASAVVEVDVTGIPADALSGVQALLMNTAIPESHARIEYDRPQIGEGRLSFVDVAPGEYMLIVSGAGGETAVVNNIDVRSGEMVPATVDLSLPDVELSGKVVSAGSALVDATVRMRFADVPEAAVLIETSSGNDGRFSLFPLQAARSYLVEISNGPDTQSWRVEVPVASPKYFEREFQFVAPVEVTLAWPQSLAARLAPGVPAILRNPAAGTAQVVGNPGEPAVLRLLPGRYDVSLGEVAVGFVEVPRAGGTAHVIAN